MIALYLLGLVALWAVLSKLLWKAWRRIRQNAGKNQLVVDVAFGVFAIAWLAVSFWYGGGRKFYYDAEVKRLCAIDGGIKVYETITLPADRFNSYGNIGVQIKGNEKPTDEYYYDFKDKYLKAGNPSILRNVSQLIRRNDGKVLGEAIRYVRGGGDLYGPWMGSSFDCPSNLSLNLEKSIFKKEQ